MAEIKLTTEQQAVVDNRGGALLVSAAAGSGKTKVLLDRVLKRVEEEQADLDDFLMITFTNAAAGELRGKLLAQLNERLTNAPDDRHLQRQLSRVYLAQISTVDAFCARILREYAHKLEIPADFRICEDRDAELMQERAMQATMEEIYASPEMDAEYAAALEMLGAGRDDAELPALIRKMHKNAQCRSDPNGWLQELRACMDFSQCTDVGQTLWGSYLMREARIGLEGLARRMERCAVLIRESKALAPYLPIFTEDAAMLRRMKACAWEELRCKEPLFETLPRVKAEGEDDLKSQVQKIRNQVKKKVAALREQFVIPSEKALSDLSCCADALRGLLRLTQQYSERYLAEKRRRHTLDYNDLEHEMLRLLLDRYGNPTAAAREISARFLEIMVDEYQDTNAVQDAIFRAISREGQNLFFVGDVKQAIYRFRLADPTIFLEKYRRFADYTEAKSGEPRKILLSDNFRSHPAILEAANDVFSLTMTERVGGLRYGSAEALRTLGWQQPDMGAPAVELHCIDSSGYDRSEIEAEFVAQRIEKMLADGEMIPEKGSLRPIAPEDIVILMRAPSGRAETYLHALQRHGIRGTFSRDNIFDAEEVKHLIALLQVIDNPHQDIPLLTVLLSPLFCLSADTLAEIRAGHRDGDIFDALQSSEKAEHILQAISCFRNIAQTESIRSLLDALDEKLFLRAIYRAKEGGEERIHNLDAFFALADSYENGERSGLNGFLRYVDSFHGRGGGTDEGCYGNAVRILSVHSSKGLEFPVVFLANLCGEFNLGEGKSTVLTDTELGLGARVSDPINRITYPTAAHAAIKMRSRLETLSDEMRILYVAMTRPKYRLIMSCCAAKIDKTLETTAKYLSVPAEDFQIEECKNAGGWVLMAAMTHTEAGELFAIGGYPTVRKSPDYPWKITFCRAERYLPQPKELSEEKALAPEPLLKPQFLHYAHAAATSVPSKLTATQLKGRALDEEIADDAAPQLPKLSFTRPQLRSGQRALTATERGTALHLAMQFLRYENCGSLAQIEAELDRLAQERYLTAQQRQAVPAEKLDHFFRSELGERVLSAEKLLREFKFSVLQDAALIDPRLTGEQVLLQGVTDCCIFEEDGMVILDFKSDRVKAGEETRRAENYRGQMEAYSLALSRIFAQPVKDRILYFFATDKAVRI